VCVLLGLIPVRANLANEAVLGSLGLGLGLLALGLEESAQLSRVPAVVGCDNVVIPVLLDKVLKILAVGRGGIWDRVVSKPALQLSLMPFVVGYITMLALLRKTGRRRCHSGRLTSLSAWEPTAGSNTRDGDCAGQYGAEPHDDVKLERTRQAR
jgi:hypothetical protein